MPIRVLADAVAHKIAAGEVIERPASVVRELVENSLDAGAAQIRVTITGGGLREIVVADDGAGIAAADASLAFARHATSKMASLDDLDHLRTLGFRGEALFSIAAVADVTLTTRHQDEEVGTRLAYAFGERHPGRAHSGPSGTIVQVRDLFANLPARRKFLRKPDTEGQQVVATVSRCAVAHPGIAFALQAEGREVLRTLGGTLLDAIRRVHGPEVGDALVPAAVELDGVRVHGYVAPPHLHRSAARHIDIFVNGRAIQDRALHRAVMDAYRGLLPSGRYPLAVLLLEVPPDRLDVNVHPAKSEVRFSEPEKVFSAVSRAVREAVSQADLVPPFAAPDDATGATSFTWEGRRALLSAQAAGHAPALESDSPGGARDTAVSPASLPPLRPIGQVHQTYIIAEGPDGLYLVDQHAAHERVLFDRFMRERAAGMSATQQLLTPLPLELGSERAGRLARLLPRLRQFGIDIEPFGPGTAMIRGVPAMLAQRGGALEEAVLDVFDALASGDEERWLEHSLVRLVCHAAVRAGETLDLPRIREILRELEATASPRTCPHGRPTMLYFSANQMEREFRRR